MLKAISLFLIVVMLVASCGRPSVLLTYKNRDAHAGNIQAVLVAAVIRAEDTTIRSQVEKYFALELQKAGYNALPSSTAFGSKGLADLGQEETLVKLCNYGFDAVFTIALIDASKEAYNSSPGAEVHTANYYLDRIWNYERIQADLSPERGGGPHFWECILYDLYALQPLSAIQTRLYDLKADGTLQQDLAKKVIAKMTKERILRKRHGNKRSAADQLVAEKN